MSTVYIPGAERPRNAHGRGGAGGPLGIAGLCILALALTWVVTALVPAGQFKDAVALHHFTVLRDTPAHTLASVVLLTLEPPLYIAAGVALVLLALAREPGSAAPCWRDDAHAAERRSAQAAAGPPAHPYRDDQRRPRRRGRAGTRRAAIALALCAVLGRRRRRRPIVTIVGAGLALGVGSRC